MSVRENYKRITEQIQISCDKTGRNFSDIKLIGVSKTFSAENIREAYEAGIKHFGENKVQEASQKFAEVNDLQITRHFIGHLQSNKIKNMLQFTDLLHTLDSYSLAQKIADKVAISGKKLDVLIQVNTSREKNKSGVEPEKAEELVQLIRQLGPLRLCGLMTIGTHTENEAEIRKSFSLLREIRDANQSSEFGILSMGMSSDYQIAIEEGATHLRIGGALFGERVY